MTSAEDVDYSTVRLKEPMDEEGAASFKVSLNLGLSPCASFVCLSDNMCIQTPLSQEELQRKIDEVVQVSIGPPVPSPLPYPQLTYRSTPFFLGR